MSMSVQRQVLDIWFWTLKIPLCPLMLGVLLLISAKTSRTYSLEGEPARVRKNSCGWWGWEMGARGREEELSESNVRSQVSGWCLLGQA